MPKRSAEYMDAQRETVLNAAVKCIARNGFRRTSTDDIARAAGCGKSAIYAHFPSKVAIIDAIVERNWQRFEAVEVKTLRDLIRYLASTLFNLDSSETRHVWGLARSLLVESTDDPALADINHRYRARSAEAVLLLIRNLPEAAGLTTRELQAATRRVEACWAGLALSKITDPATPIETMLLDLEISTRALVMASRRSPARPSRRPTAQASASGRRRTPAAGRRTTAHRGAGKRR
jgi:AcrR family transcriptional regulator